MLLKIIPDVYISIVLCLIAFIAIGRHICIDYSSQIQSLVKYNLNFVNRIPNRCPKNISIASPVKFRSIRG